MSTTAIVPIHPILTLCNIDYACICYIWYYYMYSSTRVQDYYYYYCTQYFRNFVTIATRTLCVTNTHGTTNASMWIYNINNGRHGTSMEDLNRSYLVQDCHASQTVFIRTPIERHDLKLKCQSHCHNEWPVGYSDIGLWLFFFFENENSVQYRLRRNNSRIEEFNLSCNMGRELKKNSLTNVRNRQIAVQPD